MSSDTIVQLRGISKSYELYRYPWHRLMQTLSCGRVKMYQEFLALHNVSFEVKRGECVGIIGRNGAGKSTLLQILAKTLQPTSGELSITGKVAALLELGSGFNPEFTGRENIFMNGAVLGLSHERIKEKLEDIINFADIGDAINQPVKTYSSGMVMRLAFAVAAHVDADILIIDEALTVGDVVFVQKCFAFLRDFIKRHTVLLVSHDIASVRDLCDRAIWLVDGEIREDGVPQKVTDDYLAYCYESKQGASKQQKVAEDEKKDEKPHDVRQAEWQSNPELVPHYQIFEFNENAPCFGKGGARIREIGFYNEKDEQIHAVGGGENVTLRMRIDILEQMHAPIVGFAIRNNRGENLFGDNTFEFYQNNPVALEKGDTLEACFGFEMPRIPPGEYALHAAIAEGTQDEHVQQQWFHNALTILSTYHGKTGVMVGIPMHRIALKRITGETAV